VRFLGHKVYLATIVVLVDDAARSDATTDAASD
jgi:hypothetical protein